MFLKTAENTYNETMNNIGKFESMEQYLDELQFSYDAVIYYIVSRLGMEMNDDLYAYLDDSFTKGKTWEQVYENIHEVM